LTTRILEMIFGGGLGFREVMCLYHVLSCTADMLIVLLLHVANPSKQEIVHSFFLNWKNTELG